VVTFYLEIERRGGGKEKWGKMKMRRKEN